MEQRNYIAYYNRQLEDAREYQDYVTDELFKIGISLNCYGSLKYQYNKGESLSGIEIKLDKKYKRTGNLYIEYAEKRINGAEFMASGIERNDNAWLYCIGDYTTIYLMAKNWLQHFKKLKELKHITTETSKGFLLPEVMARKYAIKIIY